MEKLKPFDCPTCGVLMPGEEKKGHKCEPAQIFRYAKQRYELEDIKKGSVIKREAEMPEKQALVPVAGEKQPPIVSLMESPEKAVEILNSVKQNFKKLLVDNGEIIKIKTRQGLKEYVKYEGWNTIATVMGILPQVVELTKMDDGYQAKANAVLLKTGAVVGAGFGFCSRKEPNWADRPEFAIQSMAQTRAAGKCLKTILSGVITHLGFEATPAEEMVDVELNGAKQEPIIKHKMSEQETPDGKEIRYEETSPAINLISEKQQKRLYAIGKESGMPGDEFKEWLKKNYNIENTKDIKREWYDDICGFVQSYKKS